jgi:hypothetical protein
VILPNTPPDPGLAGFSPFPLIFPLIFIILVMLGRREILNFSGEAQ